MAGTARVGSGTSAPSACGGGCSHCALREGCDETEAAGAWRGSRFAVAAAAYFLVPVVLAGAGVALGGTAVGQSIGAAAGLGIGMVACAWAARRRRSREEAAWQRG